MTNNVVAHNKFDGIAVCCGPSAYNNLVAGNEIRENGVNGIIVDFGAHQDTVRANHISGNGDDVAIFDGPDNRVTGNVISDARGCSFCDPPTGFGIAVGADADNTSVVGNVVSGAAWTASASGSAISTRAPSSTARSSATTSSATRRWTTSASTRTRPAPH